MYRAHSKDINRNKSFHPLTYGNLRRVEVLKEKAELDKEKAAERLKELQRDQEERRYDELVLTHSADSLTGELARYRQTRSIFAAEYEAEAHVVSAAVEATTRASEPSTGGNSASPAASFLSKFKKDPEANVKGDAQDDNAASASNRGVTVRKREREEVRLAGDKHDGSGDTSSSSGPSAKADGKHLTSSTSPAAPAPVTGFVTSAEAAQLRKELNLVQKRRHDPLMRVKQYQNNCVAAAAAQKEHLEQQNRVDASKRGSDEDNKEKLQSRIRALLALKTGKHTGKS